MLGAIKRIQESANDTSAKQSEPCNASRELLRKACTDTIVLLKNQPMKVKDQTASKKNLLPLQAGIKTIAVIGPNATDVVISGGGSAALRPTYIVSPLVGIQNAAKKIGAEVVHTIGVNDTRRYFPAIDPYLTLPVIPSQATASQQVKAMIGRATTGDTDIGLFESWNAAPTDDWMDKSPDFEKKPPKSDYSKSSYTASCFFLDEDVSKHCVLAHEIQILIVGYNDRKRTFQNIAGQGYISASSQSCHVSLIISIAIVYHNFHPKRELRIAARPAVYLCNG